MRAEKKAIADELAQLVDEAEFSLFVDYCGLSVEQMSGLRSSLREQDTRFQVVKNAYLKVACERSGQGECLNGVLDGPVALLSGRGDVAMVAKTLSTFIKANEKPTIKGGILDGKALSADDVKAIASLPCREAMLGSAVGTIAAPLSGMVGVLSQKLASLIYVLKAVEEKKQ